tara:strand:+ start:8655 stop:8933 length:279 start_codon:yes stop_codon:yes gene_type:complete
MSKQKPNEISECKECLSTDIAWFTTIHNRSSVQQNRLNTHDVECHFVLGCNYCSETLAVISADDVADDLNSQLAPRHIARLEAKKALGESEP